MALGLDLNKKIYSIYGSFKYRDKFITVKNIGVIESLIKQLIIIYGIRNNTVLPNTKYIKTKYWQFTFTVGNVYDDDFDFMKYCDLNERILEWGSEEIVVPYKSPLDGKYHRYFVDFQIQVQQKDGKLKRYFSVAKLEQKDHEELMNLYIEYVVLAEDYV